MNRDEPPLTWQVKQEEQSADASQHPSDARPSSPHSSEQNKWIEKPKYVEKPSYRSRARAGKRMGAGLSIGELLGPTLKKHKLGYGMARSQAILMWPKAVGPEVARITQARSFQYGTLWVEAKDSAVAHHLSMQRVRFMHRLNELLLSAMPEGLPRGERPELVHEIRFGTQFSRDPSSSKRQEAHVQLPPLPPAEAARAQARAEAVPEGSLRGAVARAAEATARARLWREQQGLPPCPVCGMPSRHKPCKPCQLTLREPAVRRMGRALISCPELVLTLEDRLGVSGAQAARFIAVEELESSLKLLALECVERGGAEEYHDFLRQKCHDLLSIRAAKPLLEVTRADYADLPEQVRQVLEAGQR